MGQAVLKDQAASVNDAGMSGHLIDFTEQVAGNHNGHAIFLGEGAYEFAHLLNACGIQAVGGLIQKEKARPSQKGSGQPQALLHAEGIVAGFLVLLFFHPHDAQHFIDLRRRNLLQQADDFQVFSSGKMCIIGRRFDEGTGFLKDLQPVLCVHYIPQDFHLPFIGLYQPQEHFHRGAFARPVGAEEAVNASFRDLQIHMVHTGRLMIFFGQILCFYGVCHDSLHSGTRMRGEARKFSRPFFHSRR